MERSVGPVSVEGMTIRAASCRRSVSREAALRSMRSCGMFPPLRRGTTMHAKTHVSSELTWEPRRRSYSAAGGLRWSAGRKRPADTEVSWATSGGCHRASRLKKGRVGCPSPFTSNEKARWRSLVHGEKKNTAAEKAGRVPCMATRSVDPLDHTKGSYLVDPASNYMLVLKIKPCKCKYGPSFMGARLRTAH